MQKSTPLSQLPNMNLPSNAQQYNMMPPPQQAGAVGTSQQDPTSESPAAIQDALESLNAMPQQQQFEQQQQQQQQIPEMPPAYDPFIPSQSFADDMLIEMQPPPIDMKSKLMNDLLSWNVDLKNAVFATAFFIFLYVMPIEKYIYQYVALDKIPHSNVLVKAALMFIAMLVVAKLL